ncbi:protein of unknown function [Streptococcus thermophilus]|nr:protein of unknown function [Streptococcus thermophilus]CAD0150207.1 protein of unknown function [Streptococcus thermophilus]
MFTSKYLFAKIYIERGGDLVVIFQTNKTQQAIYRRPTFKNCRT